MTLPVSELRMSHARVLLVLANRMPQVDVDELLDLRYRVREEYSDCYLECSLLPSVALV